MACTKPVVHLPPFSIFLLLLPRQAGPISFLRWRCMLIQSSLPIGMATYLVDPMMVTTVGAMAHLP